MKHDYEKALLDLDTFIDHLDADIPLRFLNHETIAHALRMMQKLQEPSEGMLETMKKIIWNNTWSKENCGFHIAKLLEQAEREIEG